MRLPKGQPRLRGTGGVAAGTFALFWLPCGRPRLRPPDPLGAPALAPLKAPRNDIGGGKAEWEKLRQLLGDEGSEGAWGWKNPRELRDLKDGEARKAELV
jgi:hypothetical protein